MKKENLFFNKELSEKKVLIASHRGVVGGGLIENTIPAFHNALLHGADIVEMDVCNSSDGKLFAYHDGYEPFHFQTDKNMKEMTAAEIEELRFTNRYFVKVNRGVETFEDSLKFLKGKCLINVDRRYRDFKSALALVKKLKMEDQVIFKTFVEAELLTELEDSYPDIMFMPLMGKAKEIEELEKHDLNYVGCELVFKTVDDDIVTDENVKYLKNRYGMLWSNPISCEDNLILTGGKDDNNSLAQGFDVGWGWLIEKGFNVLQTDWPALLYRYLQQKGLR